MKITPLILERIQEDQRSKLNISSCFLETPPKSSEKFLIYKREDAPSNFYNTKNMRTRTFYKDTSLFLSKTTYKKIMKNDEKIK
jgi:hypothetical protein